MASKYTQLSPIISTCTKPCPTLLESVGKVSHALAIWESNPTWPSRVEVMKPAPRSAGQTKRAWGRFASMRFYVFLLFYTVFRKVHRIRMIMYAKYPKYDVSVLCGILLYLVTCSTSTSSSAFLYIVLFVSCSILVSLAGTQRVGCTPQIAHHTKLQTAIPSMASQEIAWMAVQASRSC